MDGIHRYAALTAPLKNGSSVSSPKGPGADALRRTPSDGDIQAGRLAKACEDFEAIFVEQLFKTMRASLPTTGLLGGGRAEEIYTTLLDQQIAQEMAHGQGGLGLAHQMQSRLTHKGGADAAEGTPRR